MVSAEDPHRPVLLRPIAVRLTQLLVISELEPTERRGLPLPESVSDRARRRPASDETPTPAPEGVAALRQALARRATPTLDDAVARSETPVAPTSGEVAMEERGRRVEVPAVDVRPARGGSMLLRAAALACAALVALTGSPPRAGEAAAAEEGEAAGAVLERALAAAAEYAPATREKLAKPVTLEDGELGLAEFAEEVAGQSGLAFVASGLVADLPEPVAVTAEGVPAGELVQAAAFALDLEYTITRGGVVAFRLRVDDPRREAMLRRLYHPRRGGREGEERRGEEGRWEEDPALDEGEVIERVSRHPKVAAVLEKLGARLEPAEFLRERRAWVLVIRREDGPPLGRAIATEHGELMDIRLRERERPPGRGDREKRPPWRGPGDRELF
jgi:hypothetical protein